MVFIYPTDTSYALGCMFDDEASIEKILRMKNRKDKKFTLIASSLSQVQKFFHLNPFSLRLAKQYWPGPLSLVVNAKFAIRVPARREARSLAQIFQKPILATSANISGKKESYVCPDLFDVDFRINMGPLKKIKPSTIVDARRGKMRVIRRGSITLAVS